MLTGFNMPLVADDYLEKTKKNWDGVNNRLSTKPYNSFIKKINNYEVFVMDNEWDSTGDYIFICISNSKKYEIIGKLEYNTSQHSEAYKMLEELLKSINFKK